MKRCFATFFLLLGIAMGMTGCGLDAAPSRSQNLLYGKHPYLYYRRFVVAKNPDGNYRYLSSYQVMEIKNPDSGAITVPTLSLYLRRDYTFVLTYQEMVTPAEADVPPQHSERKIFKGQWEINGMELVLKNLGHGMGEQKEGRDLLWIEFEHDLISTGLKGRQIYFIEQFSKQNPLSQFQESDETSDQNENVESTPVR